MKKNFLYIVILIIVFNIGCTKQWLDVNEDPNNASDASPEQVFPAAVASIASLSGGWYNLIGGFWSQYWTQSNSANQFKFIDMYEITEASFDRQWIELYSGALSDFQYVIDKAKKDKNNTYVMMATVMQAYSFALAVDFYDNVPYFDALKGDSQDANLSPKFDNGKDIYLDLLKRIDEVTKLELNKLSPEQEAADFLFEGDIDSWLSFAKTLKLKMYLRMVNADPAAAEAGVRALYADASVKFMTNDAALTAFTDNETQSNPLYESVIRKLNVSTNLRVSTTIYKYFQSNGDPRLEVIVQNDDKGKNPLPQGGFNISNSVLPPTKIPIFQLSPTTPVYFISEVESMLLQAEACMRGWGTGDAKTLYDAGVTAEFARKGLKDTASYFIGAGGKYEYPTAGTQEDQLKAIIMAKWAAFAGTQSAEAFFETCRTGYPVVSPIPAWKDNDYNLEYKGGELTYSLEGSTGGVFPQRLIYPKNEINLNTTNPKQSKTTDKVWWAKN